MNDASKVAAGIRHEDNCQVNRPPLARCDCGHGTRGNGFSILAQYMERATYSTQARSVPMRDGSLPTYQRGHWQTVVGEAIRQFDGPHNEGMAEFFKKPLDV